MATGHGHNIPQIDVSDDDARLVSASIDGSVRIWDLASRTLLYS
jgi:WD40 repeat protein